MIIVTKIFMISPLSWRISTLRGPYRIRTCGFFLAREALYQAELMAQRDLAATDYVSSLADFSQSRNFSSVRAEAMIAVPNTAIPRKSR